MSYSFETGLVFRRGADDDGVFPENSVSKKEVKNIQPEPEIPEWKRIFGEVIDQMPEEDRRDWELFFGEDPNRAIEAFDRIISGLWEGEITAKEIGLIGELRWDLDNGRFPYWTYCSNVVQYLGDGSGLPINYQRAFNYHHIIDTARIAGVFIEETRNNSEPLQRVWNGLLMAQLEVK